MHADRVTNPPARDERGLLRELIADGQLPLSLTAAALFVSGAFALFLAFRREFLPHDVAFLGMTAEQLCAVADCRVVRFMFHDRVAFGGTLLAVAVLYQWLTMFPLREGHRWAWWTLAASGALGFGSFLTYLSYGYLDDWHGAATLVLLPVFATGLIASRSRATLPAEPWSRIAARSAAWQLRAGRFGLLATALGIALAGTVILYLGSTEVFVPQDLGFMGVSRRSLDDVNARLVPLIAHDRAGFGGGLATTGVLLLAACWYARPSRAFHQTMLLAGAAGFGCAIGTHFVEGYTNPLHLAPAVAGALLFAGSIGLEMHGWRQAKTGAAQWGAPDVERVHAIES
jgi:hypothetical protein